MADRVHNVLLPFALPNTKSLRAAVAPYNALYGAHAHGVAACDAAPIAELANAIAALTQAIGPKARMDALPVLKAASEKLDAYLISLEQWRNAA